MIKINGIEIKQDRFPDNTLLTKINPEIFHSDSNSISISWYYENDAELFTLICIKRYLDKYFQFITLYMPYIPNARMDRTKNLEDIFTLKYFCEIINSLHFSSVTVRDAHSNVSLALLDNVYEEDISFTILELLKSLDNPNLFFPDEGAMKRYSSKFNAPYAFGMKNRDWKTGEILGLDIIHAENIKDKNVLIIDDICSRGGTFLYSAKALKAGGAKDIYLYVTHLEETVFEGQLLSSGLIKKIFTTKSIFPEDRQNEMIEIIM